MLTTGCAQPVSTGYGPGMDVVIALDAGTTSIRSVAFDEQGTVVATARQELPQHFPGRGRVEHDAAVIWDLAEATLAEVAETVRASGGTVQALGITNQRETAVAWDRSTGSVLHPAIVWQDRRTAGRCDALREAGHLDLVRKRTGLVLDPYFSATKWAWMLEEGGVPRGPALALGTVDSWLVWQLTGGGAFVTDVTNASRSLCLDISDASWSAELCDLFGVPIEALAEVRPSAGRLGEVGPHVAGGALAGVPISGVAGDQQAALFGQGCFAPGDTKSTYGTGTFVLMNAGRTPPAPVEGLLTTIAWDLGGGLEYALEGAVFATGATIQWLRDGLEIIPDAASTGALAASIVTTDGVYIVPAFTGLGSPWWDPYARGTVVGITRGSGRAHFARAAVEAMAYQTRDVVDAMRAAADHPLATLAADGGAAVMDLLLQLQADQLRCPVVRRATTEVTALGAALLAGIAEGVWAGREEVRTLLADEAVFEPRASAGKANADYAGWLRAVERARGWEVLAAEA
jgi:glycerol kinase